MTSSSTSWKKIWILSTVTLWGMTQRKTTDLWEANPLSNPHTRWEALHPSLFTIASGFLAGCWNPYIHLFYFLPFIFNSETSCPLLEADIRREHRQAPSTGFSQGVTCGLLKTVAGGATGCRVWEIMKYCYLEWNPGLGDAWSLPRATAHLCSLLLSVPSPSQQEKGHIEE